MEVKKFALKVESLQEVIFYILVSVFRMAETVQAHDTVDYFSCKHMKGNRSYS